MYSLAMLLQIKSALEGRIELSGEHVAPAERSVSQAALGLTNVLIVNSLFASSTPIELGSTDVHNDAAEL